MAKAAKTETAAMARQESKKNASLARSMTKIATTATTKLDALGKRVSEQNSVERALTVDAGSAVLAHTANELIGFGARALADYSLRTAGKDGHFAKNVAWYSSVPQSAVGFIVYALELATRGKRQLNMGLGREIAHRASNLLANLGVANSIRALRYHLSQSIDETAEQEAERRQMLDKITALSKELESVKGGPK